MASWFWTGKLTIFATTQTAFTLTNFWKKKMQKLCSLQNWWNPSMSDTKKEIWFNPHLLRSYSSNKVKSLNFIVIHSVASKCNDFRFPCAERFQTVYIMSDFCSDNFQSLLYLKLHVHVICISWESSLWENSSW